MNIQLAKSGLQIENAILSAKYIKFNFDKF